MPAEKLPRGEALRRLNDAHVRAIQARRAGAPDSEVISTEEAARRLGLSASTFRNRIAADPQLRSLVIEEAGSAGAHGLALRWRWGDLRVRRDQIVHPPRLRGELPRMPLTSAAVRALDPGTGGTAKRVAQVTVPAGSYSVYEVKAGERLPNRCFAPEPGLWATDGARTQRLPWGLDELARVLCEGEPIDGVRTFGPMTAAAVVPVVLPKPRRRKVAAQALAALAVLLLPVMAGATPPEIGGHRLAVVGPNHGGGETPPPEGADVPQETRSYGAARGARRLAPGEDPPLMMTYRPMVRELAGCSAAPSRGEDGQGTGARLAIVLLVLIAVCGKDVVAFLRDLLGVKRGRR